MKYSKIGEFVDFAFAAILAAVVLAFLMLTGCTDEGGRSISEMGGSAEETSAQASLEKLTIAGKIGSAYPRIMNLTDGSGNVISPEHDNNVVFAEGSVVTVYELDSVSLDTTGDFFVGSISDDGKFTFENVTLKSPYVLISVLDSCKDELCSEKGIDYYKNSYNRKENPDSSYQRLLSAVVDLREFKNISVNILTHLKVPVLRGYVADGYSFAEANSLAEQTVLEGYGVYEKMGAFENLDNGDSSDLIFVGQIAQEYEIMDEWTKNNDEYFVQRMIGQYWFASPKIFSKLGKEMESLYRNTMKMIEYKGAYWAHHLGKGRCTEEREGEMFYNEDLRFYRTYPFVCRSGKWVPGYKKIEYTKDSLVDSRDGKTYKTVTYNIGGVSYTWMADDLSYTGSISANGDSLKADLLARSICSYKKEKSCELSSREYKWEAAANVSIDSVKLLVVNSKGDTVIMPEMCKNSLRIMCDSIAAGNPIFCNLDDGFDCLPNLWGYAVGQGPCDSIMNANGGLDATSWNYAELLPEYDPSSYQGICPEGFRLPNVKDWAALIGYMEEQYGVDSSAVGMALLDEVATGFGMKNELLEFDTEYMWIFVSSFHNYIGIPDYKLNPNSRISGVQISDGSFAYWTASDYNYVFDPYLVRCVKND